MNTTVFGMSSKLEPGMTVENEYGLRNGLKHGIRPMSCAIEPAHPLQLHEENYSMMDEKMGMKLLREVQGLHAPLKLATEIRATKLIGHLPFLQCSKLSFATVKGLDDVIDFTDILNPVDLFEKNIVPHVAMEA